jgi:hypothetical protein
MLAMAIYYITKKQIKLMEWVNSGGMQAIEIALVYGEQQLEATGMTWP